MSRAAPMGVAMVEKILGEFGDRTTAAFGGDLRSAIVYGSAAEGSLRKTSDVNLLLVLAAFERERADRLREPLRLARAAIRLTVIFLLESEIESAVQAFAVTFDDILHRRRVILGADPFATLSIPRAASIG